MTAVPRSYEKIYAAIINSVQNAPLPRRKTFRWALEMGKNVAELKKQKQTVPMQLKLRHLPAEALVLKKIQSIFGGVSNFSFPEAPLFLRH